MTMEVEPISILSVAMPPPSIVASNNSSKTAFLDDLATLDFAATSFYSEIVFRLCETGAELIVRDQQEEMQHLIEVLTIQQSLFFHSTDVARGLPAYDVRLFSRLSATLIHLAYAFHFLFGELENNYKRFILAREAQRIANADLQALCDIVPPEVLAATLNDSMRRGVPIVDASGEDLSHPSANGAFARRESILEVIGPSEDIEAQLFPSLLVSSGDHVEGADEDFALPPTSKVSVATIAALSSWEGARWMTYFDEEPLADAVSAATAPSSASALLSLLDDFEDDPVPSSIFLGSTPTPAAPLSPQLMRQRKPQPPPKQEVPAQGASKRLSSRVRNIATGKGSSAAIESSNSIMAAIRDHKIHINPIKLKGGYPAVVFDEEPGSIISFALTAADDGPFAEGVDLQAAMMSREEPLRSAEFDVVQDHVHRKYKVKCLYPRQFKALRAHCIGDESAYVSSLYRCVDWAASGGKSGSLFVKTRDDRFILKEVSYIEMQCFNEFAPHYFEYMTKAFFHNLPSSLCRLLGMYKVSYNNDTSGRVYKRALVVMENLFYNRNISKKFDLKGSHRSRYVRNAKSPDTVLLDDNLVEFIFRSPLYVHVTDKDRLRNSIFNDTLFLSQRNVVDYSLLVGIDGDTGELVVGIIDYIRQYTLDKKFETLVKSTGLIGTGKGAPTVVSPKDYKKRFRASMEAYFIVVPDKFTDKERLRGEKKQSKAAVG